MQKLFKVKYFRANIKEKKWPAYLTTCRPHNKYKLKRISNMLQMNHMRLRPDDSPGRISQLNFSHHIV